METVIYIYFGINLIIMCYDYLFSGRELESPQDKLNEAFILCYMLIFGFVEYFLLRGGQVFLDRLENATGWRSLYKIYYTKKFSNLSKDELMFINKKLKEYNDAGYKHFSAYKKVVSAINKKNQYTPET